MEEESFVDQQAIASRGEKLKKFFIIVAGTVSIGISEFAILGFLNQ